MPQPFEVDDYNSSLFGGLSGFWQKFFRDTKDLHAYYKASEQYLGQVYLDLLGSVLSTGLVDTPVFNKEYWKLFLIKENELSFVEGQYEIDDKYKYDMPGSEVSLVLMQNSIFDPSVTFENDVDFTLKDDDGFVYFNRDIFNEVVDPNLGIKVPLSGVAWRYTNIQVGNRLVDSGFTTGNWEQDTAVRKGDTLNILAYRGPLVQEGNTGQFVVTGDVAFVGDVSTTMFDDTHVGDIIEVYASPSNPAYVGFYLVDRQHLSVNTTVYLPNAIGNLLFNLPTATSAADLRWRHYKAIYFDAEEEQYEVDYFDGVNIIGNYNTPFPLGYSAPLVYAVIRRDYDYEGSNPIQNYDGSSPSYGATSLGVKHLIPGTVRVYATRVDGRPVTEGVDYTVNYTKGIIQPLPYVNNVNPFSEYGFFNASTDVLQVARYPWAPTGIELDPIADIGSKIQITESVLYPLGEYTITAIDASAPTFYGLTLVDSAGVTLTGVTSEADIHWTYIRQLSIPYWSPSSLISFCLYEYMTEVFLSAGGRVEELASNNVRELSLWVPEVLVDRFDLYNNYGYLLNRFAASSETYKNFLRGVMYLYTSGPKLYIVEAALNVAAGYPVIRSDGEVFTGYSNGVNASGSDGVLTAVGTSKIFTSASASFSSADIGGWLVFSNTVNDANDGKYQISSVTDAHTLVLSSEFPMVSESSLTWIVSWDYAKVVSTVNTLGITRTYSYPFNIPVRADLEDPSNYNKLSFEAFEILTTAFTVTDYVEDPEWWNNKYIPSILWPNAGPDRRFATTRLYASILDSEDLSCIDDPGLFLDADDTGMVLTPTDGLGSTEVDIFRHGAAFCLMDQYLKFHMFFISIDPNVEMTQEFQDDLANIILIVKPSYTYPYVESGDIFIDSQELWDTLQLDFGYDFSGLDGIQFPDCGLYLDQPYCLDDFYRYQVYDRTSQVLASPPAAPFVLGVGVGERIVQCTIHATVGGIDALEGRDYTIDLDPESLDHGLVTPITTWDVAADITFTARTVVILNEGSGPQPDTTLGFTPLMLDGLEPGYVRVTLPTPYTRTEFVERALGITIDSNYPAGVSYIYP